MISYPRDGVVFALGNRIYHYNHSTRAVTELGVRPDIVSSFCLTERGEERNLLLDGCCDGRVRATVSGVEIMRFDSPVTGICEAYRSPTREPMLFEFICAKYGLDTTRFGPKPTIVTTIMDHDTEFHMDTRPFTHVSRGRSGLAQSLSCYNTFHWTNNGRIYTNFDKSRCVEFHDDFLQLVPSGYLADFMILCNADTVVEGHQKFLRVRGGGSNKGRVVWKHNWSQHGSIWFAGFYQCEDDGSLFNWHLLFGTVKMPRDHVKEFLGHGNEFRVWRIAVEEFDRGTPELVFETTLDKGTCYGYSNPFIADRSLLNLC